MAKSSVKTSPTSKHTLRDYTALFVGAGQIIFGAWQLYKRFKKR